MHADKTLVNVKWHEMKVDCAKTFAAQRRVTLCCKR